MDKIIISGEKKLEAWHMLMHLLERMKYAKCNSMCMARDRAECQECREKIEEALETLLL